MTPLERALAEMEVRAKQNRENVSYDYEDLSHELEHCVSALRVAIKALEAAKDIYNFPEPEIDKALAEISRLIGDDA